jgi:hypothetical protein
MCVLASASDDNRIGPAQLLESRPTFAKPGKITLIPLLKVGFCVLG